MSSVVQVSELRFAKVDAGDRGGDLADLDHAWSRIAVEDGEVSPTGEWRTWSVVGSVLRYLSTARRGSKRICCGQAVESK